MLPQIVDKTAMLPPATCFKCFADAGSPRLYFMDMGRSLDWEGAVYYCNECLYDVVKEMPDAFKEAHLNKLIDAYELEAAETRKIKEENELVISRLTYLGFDLKKLLREGQEDGRNDGEVVGTEPVPDERSRRKQYLFTGDEQETDGSDVPGKFRVPNFG